MMQIAISLVGVMTTATQTRRAESTAPSVFEQEKNHNKSRDYAREQHASLITSSERLHELLNNREFVKSLENTAHHRRTWL
jgi:hypothetical protein